MRAFLLPVMLFITGIFNTIAIATTTIKPENMKLETPSVQKNKQIIRDLYEQVLNKRDWIQLQEVVSEDFTGINGAKGAEAFKAAVMNVINALPDAQWKIEDLISEGNKVMVRWTLHGTHNGPFQFIPPTGNATTNSGLGIYELKDGKVTGAYVQTDRLGFLQDLGVLPEDLSTLIKKKASEKHVFFIDKFEVPQKAIEEFLDRVRVNRRFIRGLPGFVEDAVYHHTDESGNLTCITVAEWEDGPSLHNAREKVQSEYQKEGYNPAEMMKRLGIKMERGVYTGEGLFTGIPVQD